jgi:hypothetical protein
MTREETLATVAAESEKEFRRLTKEREKGDLFYEPRAESVFVWKLVTEREVVGMGYRDRHTYRELFATRDLAVLSACYEILKYWGDGLWSEEYR